MKDRLWSVLREYFAQSLDVQDVPDRSDALERREFSRQLEVYVEKITLPLVEEHQLRWPEVGNLPGQFRADGTSRSGDQDGFLLELGPYVPQIDAHRRAGQQILHTQAPHGRCGGRPADNVPDGRQRLEIHLALTALVDNCLHLPACGGGYGN